MPYYTVEEYRVIVRNNKFWCSDPAEGGPGGGSCEYWGPDISKAVQCYDGCKQTTDVVWKGHYKRSELAQGKFVKVRRTTSIELLEPL